MTIRADGSRGEWPIFQTIALNSPVVGADALPRSATVPDAPRPVYADASSQVPLPQPKPTIKGLPWAQTRHERLAANSGTGPFVAGENIRVPGFIKKDERGYYSEADPSQGGAADKFYLGSKGTGQFEKLLGTPIEATVNIDRERAQQTCGCDAIWAYDATLAGPVKPPVVNPPADAISSMSAGSRVVITGTIRKLVEDHTTTSQIETADHRLVDVEMPYKFSQFLGGSLENIAGKKPMVGDRVSLPVRVERVGDSTQLSATDSPTMMLLAPAPKRKDDYDVARAAAASTLDNAQKQLAAKHYMAARQALSEMRSHELTAREIASVDAAVKQFPEAESPMIPPGKAFEDVRGDIARLDERYGENIKAMGRDGFMKFAEQVASGQVHSAGEYNDKGRGLVASLVNLSDLSLKTGLDKAAVADKLVPGFKKVIETNIPSLGAFESNDGYPSIVSAAANAVKRYGGKAGTTYLLGQLTAASKKGEQGYQAQLALGEQLADRQTETPDSQDVLRHHSKELRTIAAQLADTYGDSLSRRSPMGAMIKNLEDLADRLENPEPKKA